MPPLSRLPAGRARSLPTVLSLSKLVQLAPALISRSTSYLTKRTGGSEQWAATQLGSTAATILAEKPEDPPGSPDFTWKLLVSIALVIVGGVFAG